MRELTGIVARVHTGSQTRTFDRRAMDDFSIPGIRLMLRAGRAAFNALRARWPDARRLTVVCGAGNNGGDGYVVAGLARDAGLDVQLIEVADAAKLRGDAATARRFALERLGEAGAGDWPARGEVIVDALLGTGARCAVREPYQAALDRINAAGKPVLAVDVPSGVNADTGGLHTAAPVRAALTITFVAAKIGLVTGAAVDYVGDLIVDDIGVPEAARAAPGVAVLQGAGLAGLARRPNAHKGDFGRLLVVGGETDMGGAVALAGEAALRVGAGFVTVATRGANRSAILARRPELMVRAADAADGLEDVLESATAIAAGPGLGRGAWGAALLAQCLAAGKPLVVDADGLNILAAKDGPGPADLPPGAVLTPHPGEAARLLGKDSQWVQENRPDAATKLSRPAAIVVLKGAGTLIADAGALRSICLLGNPGMATAGSGDVLTGVIGALLARGFAPVEAAELGVWLHARAGDEAAAARSSALVAGDVIEALRQDP